MESTQILERIIERGGLMAACAKRYINNKEKADQFILECYYQCHNHSAIKLWGEELVMAIQNYIHDQKPEILTDCEKQKSRSAYRSGFLDL
jgi:hypothetical protein